ncbi:hypothetical protein, partial [Proteus faecis]|uniref:hypothetical protein n=1 Tax=Proteus faecis TaxID=2050967 RepID=UPI00301DE563
FTSATTVLKYVHVATGTLSGTYLGSPPQRIDGTAAAVATASSTLTSPPKPPDASVSYPFQNFVAWNELTPHTVSPQSARPLKISRTAAGI